MALLKRPLGSRLGVQEQKLVRKAGANHACKGINPLNNRDVGNFLAERAEGRGRTSLTPIGLGSAAFTLLAGAGATDGSWSLLDLRSLRPGLRKLAAGDIDVFNLINGHDFALIIPEGSASTQLATP